jgi:hypothetical protein
MEGRATAAKECVVHYVEVGLRPWEYRRRGSVSGFMVLCDYVWRIGGGGSRCAVCKWRRVTEIRWRSS